MATFPADEIERVILSLSPEQQDALAADEAAGSFAEFARQAWPWVPQVEPLRWNWHMDALCLHAEELARGRITDLNVNVPPGHAKSVVWSVLLPAWVWTWWPRAQVLSATYSSKHASRDSMRCRALIEGEWYQSRFAERAGWRMRPDLNQQNWFANTAGGERYSTGIGGGGRRAHLIILDDVLDPELAHSPTERAAVTRWLGQTVSQRFIAGQPRRLVNVQQRLHAEDPSAWMLKVGCENLCLPSEFDPHRRSRTHHVVDGVRRQLWQDPRRRTGELLFPELFTAEILARDKLRLGPFAFAAQHQQEPTPEGGGIFKVADWRFWTADADQLRLHGLAQGSADRPLGCSAAAARHVDLRALEEMLISVDATFHETVSGSYVAMHVWGRLGARRLLLDRVHRRMDFPPTVRALLELIRRWPRARRRLVEGKANGDAIVSTLREEHGVTGLEAVNPGRASKEQRAHAMLPYHAAHNVELPEGAPWLGEYILEHANFPNWPTNDDVDAQSQGLQGFEAAPTTASRWLGK